MNEVVRLGVAVKIRATYASKSVRVMHPYEAG